MGFWRRLFGIAPALTAEEQRAREEQARQHVLESYDRCVREVMYDATNTPGCSIKIEAAYTRVVLDAVARYATQPYTVHKTSDEDMDYEGLCVIHVCFIQLPVATPTKETNIGDPQHCQN
jgi:hypothetical protein